MKTYLDCIPCLVRQTLDSVRHATDDSDKHELILRETLRSISEMDLSKSPPAMACRIHRLVRKCLGVDDPYKEMKVKSNELVLGLYPELKARVEHSTNPLETALRLAIAGNIIDVAAKNHMGEINVNESIEHALSNPLNGDVRTFSKAVSEAETILYLADNAGEIVFDRLLIEWLPLGKVTVAVRGLPTINDATMDDAETAGITDLVKVIDNGSDVPGTILDECSETFQRSFDHADLVIAKGQGNYETLNDMDKDIFFLFKVKCPIIAEDIGCHVGSQVLRRSLSATIIS